jgi:hypothetical protein
MDMQLILYGILIIVLGIVGWYVGDKYTSIGSKVGAGIGIIVGLGIAGVMWYTNKDATA